MIIDFLYIFASLAFLVTAEEAPPKLWGLLVAGANGWYNYGMQADIYHGYQVLHQHGIPDEQIVVMHYDDIAYNPQNPTPGKIINEPNGPNVYEGVPKDYTGEDVTPDIFLKVLRGDRAGLKGRGSGKVINSGPNDHIFVWFSDHGGYGFFCFPNDYLSVDQLITKIMEMHKNKRYGKLVFYVDTCYAGSMFDGVLPKNINVFAVTAANADEPAYSCYFDENLQTYVGGCFGESWMEDSDREDIQKESLDKQFQITKKEANESHVSAYGDLALAKLAVGQFQGENGTRKANAKSIWNIPSKKREAVSKHDIYLAILQKKLARAKDWENKKMIKEEINQCFANREFLDGVVTGYANYVSKAVGVDSNRFLQHRSTLRNIKCHHKLVKAFHRYCFNLAKNPYASRSVGVLVNMCEEKVQPLTAIMAMRKACKTPYDGKPIH